VDVQFKQRFTERWEEYFPAAALPIVFYYTDDEGGAERARPEEGPHCASIVYHPYHELASDRPRAVLGMFDVSARPCVPADELTFAVPWPKFVRMVGQMDESFLITGSWRTVRERIES
jgi:hypothetical protein